MTLYLVKAKPRKELMKSLREELDSNKISRLQPFGEELHRGLDNARTDDSYAYWVEEDYCTPPLAMERTSVLDRYFDDISRAGRIGRKRLGSDKGQAGDVALVHHQG